MINLLLERGADVNTKILGTAEVRSKSEGMVYFHLEKGLNMNGMFTPGATPLQCAARFGALSLVSLYLSKGALVNESDNKGGTALHYAVMLPGTDVADYLLSKGANVNTRTQDGGYTPLHSTVFSNQKNVGRIVDLLARRGAILNIKDDKGRTPLALTREMGNTEVVAALMRGGATE